MRYQIVSAELRILLEVEVNEQIRDGWEPVGGVAVDAGSGLNKYLQAMIKRAVH